MGRRGGKAFIVAVALVVLAVIGEARAGTVARSSFILFTDQYGSESLYDLFSISGAAPWDLGPLTIAPPTTERRTIDSPEWYINYDIDHTTYGPLLFPSMMPIDNGMYTYNFSDAEDEPLTGSPVEISYTYREMPDTVTDAMTTAAISGDELYVGTVTPVLAWQPHSTETDLYYRVAVFDYNGDAYLWTSVLQPYDDAAGMSVTLPAGLLQGETAYRWAVEVFDGATLATANNGARSATVSFYTGDGTEPLSAVVHARSRVLPELVQTQFGVDMVTGPAPWDVAIVITGANDFSQSMGRDHYSSDGYWSSYDSEDSASNLGTQRFTFTVTDTRDGSFVTPESEFTPNWTITPHENNSMFEVRDSIHTETPTFSWAPQAGVVYRVEILSYAQQWSGIRHIWRSAWSADPFVTVPAGILEKDNAYTWRVETQDGQGNRGRGESVPFFVADDQAPLAVAGSISIIDGVNASGLIHIEATDSPTFPGGTSYASIDLTAGSLPVGYTLHNIPRGRDVHFHALWDHDGSFSYTVGDYLGHTQAATPVDELQETLTVDIALQTVVEHAASFTGSVSCAGFVAGYGNIMVTVFNEGSDEEVLDETDPLAAPGAFSIDPALIPVGGWVDVRAFWDTDGSGDWTPTDQVAYREEIQVGVTNTLDPLDIAVRGYIAGTVRDPAGNPMAGKNVLISGAQENRSFWGGTTTDANGSYAYAVPDGDYVVNVNPYPDDDTYVVLYYNGKFSYDSADPVTVATDTLPPAGPGAIPYTVAGIDFTMVAGVHISGRVTDSGDQPVADGWVSAEDAEGVSVGSWAPTDANGEFSVLVPPGGSYYLRADATGYVGRYYNDAEPWNEDDPPIVVGATDVTIEDFTLQQATVISGTVTDGTTAIAGVWMEAVTLEGDFVEGGETGSDGTYEILVPAGTYKVRACPTCNNDNPQPYLEEYYNDQPAFDDAAQVTTSVGEEQDGIDFVLEPAMLISGHVYEEGGTTPLENVHVYCETRNNQQWTSGTNTDENGQYSLYVAQGIYAVRACPGCNDEPLPFLGQYYAGKDSFTDADDVDVTSGDREDVDFQLVPATLITGTVSQVGGQPVVGMEVIAEDPASEQTIASGRTGANGTYSLPVPAGEYVVALCPTCNQDAGTEIFLKVYYDNALDRGNATPVDTTEGNRVADFQVATGVRLAGTIYESGGSPLSGLAPEDLSVFVFRGTSCVQDPDLAAIGRVNGDGSYLTSALPAGTYYLRAQPNCIAYATPSCEDEIEVAIDVSSPSPFGGHDISLDPGGTISGFVVDRQNQGLTQINISVFSAADWVTGANTDDDRFYCIGVPPGSYRVAACPSCTGQPYIDQNFYESYHEAFTPVDVTFGGSTQDINFTLSRIVEGDVNGDEDVDLADAILGLKIITNSDIAEPVFSTGTVDGDGQIGLPEVIHILIDEAVEAPEP